MKFKIDKSTFEKFPNIFIVIPIIKGFKNKLKEEDVQEFKKLIESIQLKVRKEHPDLESLLKSEKISIYRDVFTKFGVNPDKRMPTHFALAKRVVEGGNLPKINPIVDLYNAISIKYLTPFGGENLDYLFGDSVLKLAQGGEDWYGIGAEKSKPAKEGELIWIDDMDIITRALNWRQCERTKLTEEHTNGYFIMDGFEGVNDSNMLAAANEFITLMDKYFGGESELLVLNHNNSASEINHVAFNINNKEHVESFSNGVFKQVRRTTKISINKKIFKKFPGLVEVIVVAKGMNNETKDSRIIIEKSNEAQKEFIEKYSNTPLENEPKYSKWIESYGDVLEGSGVDRKKVEKMLPGHLYISKTVLGGKSLPNINPIVNYYNSFELKNLVPTGGEDLQQVAGDLEMKFADGTENFMAMGSSSYEDIPSNEIIWRDDLTATVRMWAWRQSDRTKITKKTKDAYFVFDLLDGVYDLDNGKWAPVDEFVSGLKKYFDAEVEVYYLTEANNTIEIDYKTKDKSEFKDIDGKESEELVVKGTKGLRKRKAESMGLVDNIHFMKELEAEVAKELKGTKFEKSFSLSKGNNSKFGDFSSVIALKLAKELKVSPMEIADEFIGAIEGKLELFSEITVAPNGFINFKVANNSLLNELKAIDSVGDSYGESKVGDNRVMLVESPGWNPNKSPHVGHLLNAFLGKTLVRLFNTVGFDAKNDDIDNDKGLPVMQTIWAYMNYGKDETPDNTNMKPDQFVHKYYAIAAKEYKESEQVQNKVKEILKKWETKDEEITEVWAKIVEWARVGQSMVYEQFGEVKDAYLWHESDVYQGGKDIVTKMIGNGVIEQIEGGALIARIEKEYGLPDTIVVKSDGTGLYHTQDINLTLQKQKKFNPWRIIWVVAEEQIAHFQRLFAILDALDIMPIENLYHYAYGWVVDKDGGKLSSRDGSELSADGLHKRLIEASSKALEERNFEGTDKEKEKIAQQIAVSAVKFAYLSTDPFKKIKFDMERAVSFSGKSGPYVMYAYTRAMSILKKAGDIKEIDIKDIGFGGLDRELMLKVFQYPEVVLASANVYMPSILAEYLFDLSKSFNNFYENVSVLNAEDEDVKNLRIVILKSITTVLRNGMEILGIEVVDRM